MAILFDISNINNIFLSGDWFTDNSGHTGLPTSNIRLFVARPYLFLHLTRTIYYRLNCTLYVVLSTVYVSVYCKCILVIHVIGNYQMYSSWIIEIYIPSESLLSIQGKSQNSSDMINYDLSIKNTKRIE